MPDPSVDRLREIKTFPSLVKYLRDDLDWPIESEEFDDIIFEYSPAELGIDPGAAAKVKGIKQLRPLSSNQPWGVFLIEFGPNRLPISALRRILRALVARKRQSDRPAERRTWSLEDLLFVCAQGRPDGAAISVVHFSQPASSGKAARLASFGWSPSSRNRTVLEFNLPPLRWPADPASPDAWRQQWLKAFDKEALTRRFYQTLDRIYKEAIVPEIRKDVRDEERARQAGLLLLNRLLFLCFVQKKGWLDGKPDYLARGFDDHRDRPKPRSFYIEFLRPLFDALSRPVKDRLHDDLARFRGIPFLNGGLFEPDALVSDSDLRVPNGVFARLFDELLEPFNFTVTEDTPLDVEVAVDPEMLGKVFEELVTGRHETGAYYTPRPVVSFMCREALKGYLGGAGVSPAIPTSSEERRKRDACATEPVDRFVDQHDASGLRDPEAILQKLRAVRVCDPACGSGAYLVGMLQELLALRHCLFAAHQVDPRDDYNRKLDIIQNNLYGVDIDPVAVNIARLRLWLTLAVEYEGPGGDPPPLPNLDFKIEQGDSLLAPKPGPLDLAVDEIERLERLKSEHMREPYNKARLKRQIEDLRNQLANWVVHDQARPEETRFDWRLDFAEVVSHPKRPGFDIVLANPPYVRADAQFRHIEDEKKRQNQISRWKEYREHLKACRAYETVYEKWDLYIPFLERAWQLLRHAGRMVFIIPDAYNFAKYAAKSHSFFLKNACISRVDFCSGIDLFDAGVNNTIVTFAKAKPSAEWRPVRVRRWGETRDQFEENAELLPTRPQCEFGPEVFKADGREARAAVAGELPLERICYISKGMVIHAHERKAHLAFKAADLIFDTRDDKHPKHFVEGKDLGKWIPVRVRYLEYGTRRAPGLFSRPTFPELYEVPEKLISMDLAGSTPKVVYDNCRLFHNHSAWSFVPWHLLNGVRNNSIRKTAKYRDEADGERTRSPLYREELEEVSKRYLLKYALAVMNSSFAKQWLAQNRRSKLHIYPDDWKRLPIAPATPKEQAAIAALADKCIAARGIGCEASEREIDERVARLYGLGDTRPFA